MSEIEQEIEILENALSGALLVPSECAFVNTQVIKICLDTLKTYESWENLIRHEIEEQIRADERAKVFAEIIQTLCEKEKEIFKDKAITDRYGYWRAFDIIEELKEQK